MMKLFFRKSIHKYILEEFSFLLEYGFQMKKFTKGGDLEIIFTKDKKQIEVIYYYGINEHYEKLYSFDVIIKNEKERKRLTECHHIFDTKELQLLKKEQSNLKIRDQISLYSLFLKNNINKLLQ